jgi:hypothetical protein
LVERLKAELTKIKEQEENEAGHRV